MINNTSVHKWKRMEAKRLDQVFLHDIQAGMNCSRFESEAVLQKVHQIYDLLFEAHDALKPGQLRFTVVSVEAHVGAALTEAPQIMVVLTLDDSQEDLRIRQEKGVAQLRCHRMIRMAHEAFQQGGVLTIEDLAYRLLNCGVRTLCRDLERLRSENINVPLRSTIKDMGRTLSHRRGIVQAWLEGQEYSQIAKATHHSIPAVHNYVDKFRRTSILSRQALDVETIAFLVGISIPLALEYLDLLKNAKGAAHRLSELEAPEVKKKTDQHGGSSRD